MTAAARAARSPRPPPGRGRSAAASPLGAGWAAADAGVATEHRAMRTRSEVTNGTGHEADCFAESDATKSSKSARSIRPFASSMMRTEMR